MRYTLCSIVIIQMKYNCKGNDTISRHLMFWTTKIKMQRKQKKQTKELPGYGNRIRNLWYIVLQCDSLPLGQGDN